MNLALFFTLGVSLKKWEEVGMFDREVKPYKRLAGGFYDKIYFITYGDKEDLKYQEQLGKNIIILPKKVNLPDKLYSFLIPFVYRKELKDCDIFKTNQMAGSWAAVLAKWIYRKKLLVRCGYQWSINAKGWGTGGIKNRIIYLAELAAYRYADAISVTSDQAKEYVEKRYKIPAKKVNLTSNYIDTDLFRPIDLSKTPNSICFIGRFEKEKNLFALLEAVKNTDFKLVLFGSGKFEKELKELAQKFEIKADFRGNIPNNKMPEELNKCEAFILPSLYEGNPKVLLEAMSCGLPVIGTNVMGINNIIKNGENGCLSEISPESIRKAIKEVMENKNLKIKIGESARKYVLENCGLDKIIQKETQIVKSLFQ